MRPRPFTIAVCAVLAAGGGVATSAVAQQTSPTPDQQALLDLLGGAAAAGGTSIPGLPTPEGEDAPIPDAASPTTVTPQSTTPAPALTTPGPPAYLVPGQSAAVQPVSGVERLTEPEIPLEPVRLAALIATLLAIFGVGGAALLRSLGLRTAVVSPVVLVSARRGPFTRARDRTGTLADDVRDFLRRDR